LIPSEKLAPRVTIGITTFDRFELLIETIESIKEQLFSNFKVIIVNDNPARTLNLHSLGVENDIRFTIINQHSNLGEIRTLNLLLSLAETQYFTWLSDDDLFHPLFLQVAITELDSNQEVSAFYSSYFSGENYNSEDFNCEQSLAVHTFDKYKFLEHYSARLIQLIGSCGVFRLETLKAIGGIHKLGTGFSPYSDTLIPILISIKGKILFSNAKYVFFRNHQLSLSNSSKDLESYTSAQKEFLILIAPLLKDFTKSSKNKIFTNFFTWFSNDRAAITRRNSHFIAPLVNQFQQDVRFLLNLNISFLNKLLILLSLCPRVTLSARTLLKSRLTKLSL